MKCIKYTLSNTGNTAVNFTYRRCDDLLWEYQNELLPNQTKIVWSIDETLSSAFKMGFSVVNSQVFTQDIIFPTPTITPTNTPSFTPSPTPSNTSTPTPTITETPSETLPELTPTPTNTGTPNETLPEPTPSETLPELTPTPTITETPNETLPEPTTTPTNTSTPTPTPTIPTLKTVFLYVPNL